jgi:hypothetical protein
MLQNMAERYPSSRSKTCVLIDWEEYPRAEKAGGLKPRSESEVKARHSV